MAEMKLVPVEPTREMIEAGQQAWIDTRSDDEALDDFRASYIAMLAASPQAPAREGDDTLALRVYRHLTSYAEACSSRRENIESVRDEAFAALTSREEAPDWAAANQAAWDANNPASEEASAEGAGEIMKACVDWDEYADDIADVISDSMDMDWTSSDGARAVVRWLNENAPFKAQGDRK